MSFYLPKIIWMFVDPLALLLLAICLGVLLSFVGPWRRVGRRLLLTCATLLILVSVLPVGQVMMALLESRFPPVSRLPDKVDGIIVLGGPFSLRLSELRGQAVINDNAERLIGFADLVRRYPDAKHVFTGGSGSLRQGFLRESDIAATVFRQMGIDMESVILESEARNTYEHPAKIRRLIEPKPDETWVLITSAYHMPRAVGVFRAQNWPVLAYPVDFRTPGTRRALDLHFDLDGGLSKFSFAVHNWAAQIAYYLLGRTSELLPGAEPAGA